MVLYLVFSSINLLRPLSRLKAQASQDKYFYGPSDLQENLNGDSFWLVCLCLSGLGDPRTSNAGAHWVAVTSNLH